MVQGGNGGAGSRNKNHNKQRGHYQAGRGNYGGQGGSHQPSQADAKDRWDHQGFFEMQEEQQQQQQKSKQRHNDSQPKGSKTNKQGSNPNANFDKKHGYGGNFSAPFAGS